LDERHALSWLYSFADWERGVGWNARASPDPAWNLERTRHFLDLAGGPDRTLICILIAGTKGKGSSAAMVESIARAAGARTGLYTQPHLHHYRERIRLNGEPIGGGDFASLATRLRPLVNRLVHDLPAAGEPTTFEITTAMALAAFADFGVDVAVLEVGLGGRLDATNVVQPTVSAITRISYDHTQILGRTLGAIAREKAGILRSGVPMVSAPQRAAAHEALVRAARAVVAPHRFVEPFPPGRGEPSRGWRQPVQVVFRGQTAGVAWLPLLGDHQRENAALAVAACEELTDAKLLSVGPAAVRGGLEAVRWPGRLEVVDESPLMVVDGAHNGESAERLAAALGKCFSFSRLWLVVGLLRDKDARAFLRPLVPLAAGVVATRTSSRRALEPGELAQACRAAGARRVETAPDVPTALTLARSWADPTDLICATGSLSVVAEARPPLPLLRGRG